jgi:rhodanese-related sulfurtransferase
VPKTVKEMLDAANAVVPRITTDKVRELMAKGDVLIVDVRDANEVAAAGHVPGAVNVSRGMLESRADRTSPYHDKRYDFSKDVIVYCASGGRSALSGKVLKEMGYEKVHNLGGFKDWVESGGAVEKGT